MQPDDMWTPNFVFLTRTHTTYETNPLASHLPTWSKYDTLTAGIGHAWDTSQDWLDDYTYYAEVIGDESEDWWGYGMRTPSNGDADIPQPKVFRSYAKSNLTMLDFHRYAARQ